MLDKNLLIIGAMNDAQVLFKPLGVWKLQHPKMFFFYLVLNLL